MNCVNSHFILKNSNQFDIHLYFTKETYQSALEVRENMAISCPFLTIWEPVTRPIGPHPLPMWEAGFGGSVNLEEDLGKAILWLMENRNGHSVLIHPHTGDMLADHTVHAIWLGDRLELKLDIFDYFK